MVVSLILGQEILEVVVLVLDRADLIVLVDEVTGNKILAAAWQFQALVVEDANPSSVILAGNSGSLGRPDQRRQNMMKRLEVVVGRVCGQVLKIANGILEEKRCQRRRCGRGEKVTIGGTVEVVGVLETTRAAGERRDERDGSTRQGGLSAFASPQVNKRLRRAELWFWKLSTNSLGHTIQQTDLCFGKVRSRHPLPASGLHSQCHHLQSRESMIGCHWEAMYPGIQTSRSQ